MPNQKVTVDLGLEIKGALAGLKGFQEAASSSLKEVSRDVSAINKFANTLSGSFKRAAESALGFGAALISQKIVQGVGAAFHDLTSGVSELGTSLAETSSQLGVSITALQEFRFAAGRVGISVQEFDDSLEQFVRRSSEAAQGTGAAASTFRQLGIELKDANGNLKPTEEILNAVSDSMAKLPTQADRVRVGFKLFGTEGAKLTGILGSGSKELGKLREEARKYGLVTAEDAEKAQLLNDAQQNLNAALTGLRVEIGSALLPAVTSGVNTVANFLVTTRELFSYIIENFPTIVRAFQLIGEAAASAFIVFRGGAILTAVRGVFSVIATGFTTAINVIKGFGAALTVARTALFALAKVTVVTALIHAVIELTLRFISLARELGGVGEAGRFVFLKIKSFIYSYVIEPLVRLRAAFLETFETTGLGKLVGKFVDLKGAVKSANDDLKNVQATVRNINGELQGLTKSGKIEVSGEVTATSDTTTSPEQVKENRVAAAAGVAAGIFAGLKQGGKEGALAVAGSFAQALGPTVGPIVGAAVAAAQFLAQGAEQVKAQLNSILNAIPQLIVSIVDGAVAAVELLLERTPEIIVQIVQRIPEILERLLPALGRIFADIISNPSVVTRLGAALAREMPKVGAALAREMPHAAEEFLRGLKENATNFGTDIGNVGGATGGFFGGLFAGGGDVPQIPQFRNDQAVIGVKGGEGVLEPDTNQQLKRFLANAGGGGGPRQVVANLVIDGAVLASTILDLEDRGYRTSRR